MHSHEDPLFISCLFDHFSNQIIHEELLTHHASINQFVTFYVEHGPSNSLTGLIEQLNTLLS